MPRNPSLFHFVLKDFNYAKKKSLQPATLRVWPSSSWSKTSKLRFTSATAAVVSSTINLLNSSRNLSLQRCSWRPISRGQLKSGFSFCLPLSGSSGFISFGWKSTVSYGFIKTAVSSLAKVRIRNRYCRTNQSRGHRRMLTGVRSHQTKLKLE